MFCTAILFALRNRPFKILLPPFDTLLALVEFSPGFGIIRVRDGRAVLVDGKAYEKKRDGSLVPLL